MSHDNRDHQIPPFNSPALPSVIPTEAPKKPSWWRRWWPAVAVGAVALLVGVGIGGAGGSEAPANAEPAPTVTITEEVEVPVPTDADASCRDAATQLHDMLNVATQDIMIVQNEVIMTLVENLQYGTNIAEIQAATTKVQGVTATTQDLTGRLAQVAPLFERCVNP